jgi:hypothetical protein
VSRYFFDVKNGHRLIDPTGVDCHDDHEAIKAGVFIAKQIAAEVPPDQPRHISVLNSDRQEVVQVPINSNDEVDRNDG